jgi:hypothetical protein
MIGCCCAIRAFDGRKQGEHAAAISGKLFPMFLMHITKSSWPSYNSCLNDASRSVFVGQMAVCLSVRCLMALLAECRTSKESGNFTPAANPSAG